MAFRIAMCALLAQVQLPFPNLDIRRDIAETPTEVFILGPAKHIAAGYVESAEFSSDDKLLAFVTVTPKGYATNVWDRTTGRVSKIVETIDKPEMTFQDFNQALWLTTDPQDGSASQILRLDARTRNLRSFPAEGSNWQVEPSPFSDAAIFHKGWGSDRLAIIQYEGRLVTVQKPPDASIHITWEFGIPAAYVYNPGGPRGGVPHSIDLQTGKIGPLIAGKPMEHPVSTSKVRVTPARLKVGGATINGHWLQSRGHQSFAPQGGSRPSGSRVPEPSDQLRALIATDQRSAALGTNSTIVAFWDRHNIFVREIKPMLRDSFDAMFDEIEKKTLMDQAKQIGIASMIYAADADDRLPINDGSMDRLAPYLRDASFLDGFQYALNGQNLKDIKNPGETVLGRMQGRNGRAIVFADGRVIWDPKRKP